MKFTDDIVQTTGDIPKIEVRYLRDTMGQGAFIHGFNGVKVERVLEGSGKVRYEKSSIPHKPAEINAKGIGYVDDTPENRAKVALFCSREIFAVSQKTWEEIGGEAILKGGEAAEAEVKQVEKSEEVEPKIKAKKTRVSSKKTTTENEQEPEQ